MNPTRLDLHPGDWVEVKHPNEIAQTLDEAGTLDNLPFMPEMLVYCGRRFRVNHRVVKVCASGMKTLMFLGQFRNDDVVVLDLRCTGVDHGGCQKACVIFWREAWLRRVEEGSHPVPVQSAAIDALRSRLRTSVEPNRFFCQASELLKATRKLGRFEKYCRWFGEIRARNCNPLEMVKWISIFIFWKLRYIFLGPYAAGSLKSTPREELHLQAGEWVEVKPMASIRATLDRHANNRGLWFSPAMRSMCGQRRRVERRIERLIVDGTGEMRHMHDTVFLEGSHCGCAHIAFGGCSRCEFVYWREIWLRRVNAPSSASKQVVEAASKT